MDNMDPVAKSGSAIVVCRGLRENEHLPPRKLLSAPIQCPMGPALMDAASGDWSGDFEVWGGLVYLQKDGKLLVGPVGSAPGALAPMGGPLADWNGDVEIADGFVYMARDGALYGAQLTPDGKGIQSALAEIPTPDGHVWFGDIEVAGGYIYLARSNDLWRTPISGTTVSAKLAVFNYGGWSGEFEISDGMMYLLKNGKLYRGPLGQSLSECGTMSAGDFEVSGGVLYLTKPE